MKTSRRIVKWLSPSRTLARSGQECPFSLAHLLPETEEASGREWSELEVFGAVVKEEVDAGVGDAGLNFNKLINPLFPALRSGPTAGSGAARKKQITAANPLQTPFRSNDRNGSLGAS
jgi:hypothetical protein